MMIRILFLCFVSFSFFGCSSGIVSQKDNILVFSPSTPNESMLEKKNGRKTKKNGMKLRAIRGVISRNSLYDELLSHGILPSDIVLLNSSFEKVFSFKNSRPDDRYTLFVAEDSRLQKFIYENRSRYSYTAEKDELGAFVVSREPIKLDKQVVAMEFDIKSNIYNTITARGERTQLADMFVDIFSWDINFYIDLRDGESVKILVEKFYNGDVFVDYGKILAAQYMGKSLTYTGVLFKHENVEGYYDEYGNSLRKNFLKAPVKFARKTSGFCLRRFHPVSKKYMRHTGVDYGAKMGTPIFATASGIVKFSGWMTGYGKVVVIGHESGHETYYGHCSELLIRMGQKVRQGELIARVGKTGIATGPHVHYEIRVNGNPIDPGTLKIGSGSPVPSRYLTKFNRTVQARLNDMTSLIADAAVQKRPISQRKNTDDSLSSF